MTDQVQPQSTNDEITDQAIEGEKRIPSQSRRWRGIALKSLVLLVVFAIGSGGGFLMGRKSVNDTLMASATATAEAHDQAMSMMEQINPREGYKIPAVFGDIGPQLVAAGAIDMPKFINLYKQQNQPLSGDQMTMLTKGTNDNVVITPQNAYFLLNFFWAFGLTNQNPILTDGLMMSGGVDNVGSYASTGGWTLGVKEATDLYASKRILNLTDEQQARLLEVASQVYRPCCNNPTHYPDCNHGMAMLGLLELMAAQNATEEQMYEAAKYVTAFWYPQQMLEIATAFQALKSVDFKQADAKTMVSRQYASGSGFQAVHQWLGQNGLLEEAPSSGGSCGVK